MLVLFTLAFVATSAPPDAAWVAELAPRLQRCDRRGTDALTSWACPHFKFAVCHKDCDRAVAAIAASTTRRYLNQGKVESEIRRLPVEGQYAKVERTNWLKGPGSVAASLDVLRRGSDALVCGVSPMNPDGEFLCDTIFATLAKQDLTRRPAPTLPKKVEPLVDPEDFGAGADIDPLSQAKKPKRVKVRKQMSAAIRAYSDGDYERAGAIALQVVSSPRASDRERQEALVMTGAVHRLQGRDAQARASFLRVLEDDKSASIPHVYPAKVRRFFNMVKDERRALKPTKAAPSPGDLDIGVTKACRNTSNGQSRTVTCPHVQMAWQVHKSASEASEKLQRDLMAMRGYPGVELKTRYVECLIGGRGSRCIDMTVDAGNGKQRALLGYAEVKGRMLTVSCRWEGNRRQEPKACRKLVASR